MQNDRLPHLRLLPPVGRAPHLQHGPRHSWCNIIQVACSSQQQTWLSIPMCACECVCVVCVCEKERDFFSFPGDRGAVCEWICDISAALYPKVHFEGRGPWEPSPQVWTSFLSLTSQICLHPLLPLKNWALAKVITGVPHCPPRFPQPMGAAGQRTLLLPGNTHLLP